MALKNGQAMKTSCQLSYDKKCSSHVYDDDGSCMAIYLGMAMEMPVGMVAALRKIYGGYMIPTKSVRYQRGQQWWKGESAYNPWTQHQS